MNDDPKLRYKVKSYPIYENGEIIDFNDSITNRDIEDLFRCPKIGQRISFGKAFTLRLNASAQSIINNIKLIGDYSLSLPHWANLNGFYIEFDENEIEILEGAIA